MTAFPVRLKRFVTVRLINTLVSLILCPPVVRSTDATLERIIQKRVSISRFGNGEFEIMRGRPISFQEQNLHLRERLREIIVSNETQHIVGIPDVFRNTDRLTVSARKFWTGYINYNRYFIYRMLNRKKTYYDSLMTRLYMDYQDKNGAKTRFSRLKKIWDTRDVVIIEGTGSRLGVGNDLFENVGSLERITCPSVNAFAFYDDILAEAKRIDKDKLILIALGPTATVLAYDLARCGHQALDVGHVDIEYEWYLQQSTEKTAVKDKYVNEVLNGAIDDELRDNRYISQVIRRISP